jgi:hypothetical protein
MAAGGLSMAGSIFVFSQAMVNKERAMELAAIIKIEQTSRLTQQQFSLCRYPAIGVSLRPFQ